jgi:hypothetical protein
MGYSQEGLNSIKEKRGFPQDQNLYNWEIITCNDWDYRPSDWHKYFDGQMSVETAIRRLENKISYSFMDCKWGVSGHLLNYRIKK